MNLFVLSELHPGNNHVGWAVNYTLEKTLENTLDATFLYPVSNDRISVLKRYRQRLFKSWFKLKDLPTLGAGPNVLLIVGIVPGFLLSMHALGPWLKQFDLRIAYLLDGFNPCDIDSSVIPNLDHVFAIGAEIADEANRLLPTNASFLPLATDVFRLGANPKQRFIDIISYGRSNQDLHKCLQAHYIERESERVYFHSTLCQPGVYDLGEHVILLSKMLSRSWVSLCFEPSYVERFRGYSPILLRWFEGWAAGCTIVGRKPFGKGVASLMDWENSTVELPDEASDWIPFFEDLLNNDAMLWANAQRNYRECLLRHDWRYRIKDMLKTLELPLSERLEADIAVLKKRAEQSLASVG